jgi:hypothetical protein
MRGHFAVIFMTTVLLADSHRCRSAEILEHEILRGAPVQTRIAPRSVSSRELSNCAVRHSQRNHESRICMNMLRFNLDLGFEGSFEPWAGDIHRGAESGTHTDDCRSRGNRR